MNSTTTSATAGVGLDKPEAPAEPIYQVKSLVFPNGWHDTDWHSYEWNKANAKTVRIVYAAPAPATPAATFEWSEFERVADLPAVNEAIFNFAHDATADNATCIVRAVMEALATPLAPMSQAPSATVDEPLAWAVVRNKRILLWEYTKEKAVLKRAISPRTYANGELVPIGIVRTSLTPTAPQAANLKGFIDWFVQRNIEATGAWRAAVEGTVNELEALTGAPQAASQQGGAAQTIPNYEVAKLARKHALVVSSVDLDEESRYTFGLSELTALANAILNGDVK